MRLFYPLDIEISFWEDTIGSDGFQLEEVTRQTDNYAANQEIQSAYAMVSTHWGKRLSLMTGMRMEDSVQDVETFELFNRTKRWPQTWIPQTICRQSPPHSMLGVQKN